VFFLQRLLGKTLGTIIKNIMTQIDFNPSDFTLIKVKFQCNNCDEIVKSTEIDIPTPDDSIDIEKDELKQSDGWAKCDCGKEYDITVWTNNSSGYIEINDEIEESTIDISRIRGFEILQQEIDYYEEQYELIRENESSFNTFEREYNNLKKLKNTKIEDPEVLQILHKQTYISLITILETYLSDTFVNAVFSQEKYLKNFVKTFKDFKNHKISLNNYYDFSTKIEQKCKEALLDIIYHKIFKVKGLYKDTLSIDFADISEINKAVLIRHDLVHRNGKKKDGCNNEITNEIVDSTMQIIFDFVENINSQIERL
jgi:hypothetical protein